jgi:hypothetical protein
MTNQDRDLTISLPADDHHALLTHCAVTGESAESVVARLIRDYLAGPGSEESFAAALDRVRTEYREALDELAK